MADDEGGKTLDDKLDELKRKAAVAAARRSIEKTGHGMLDGLERWLFGKVGGAEEVLRKEANRGTALDRLRTEIEHAEAEEELTPEAPAAGPTLEIQTKITRNLSSDALHASRAMAT